MTHDCIDQLQSPCCAAPIRQGRALYERGKKQSLSARFSLRLKKEPSAAEVQPFPLFLRFFFPSSSVCACLRRTAGVSSHQGRAWTPLLDAYSYAISDFEGDRIPGMLLRRRSLRLVFSAWVRRKRTRSFNCPRHFSPRKII